jgi:hypothetical protein
LECIPRETVVQLMVDPIEAGKRAFLKHLISLLRSCRPGPLAFRLDEEERKTRLRVCLHSIHPIVHAFVNQPFDDDFVNFVRRSLPDMSYMRSMGPIVTLESASLLAPFTRCSRDVSCTNLESTGPTYIGCRTRLGSFQIRYITQTMPRGTI